VVHVTAGLQYIDDDNSIPTDLAGQITDQWMQGADLESLRRAKAGAEREEKSGEDLFHNVEWRC
jgi:hypothetical protein